MAENIAIKAIDAASVHQLQSGQVIVDLCSVAKELVENGFDAGATSIEVRFKNQGLDAIEVQDNGSGISPQNYESIARKHHTSKLSTYDDLSTLQTFGFRGEALSSLCALSHFTVVTCTQQEAPKAKKLEFETSGELKSTSIVSGQKGTTVSVENLFKNLPVRRRELERNIKREWGKVINLLNQYACVQTGVKFTVSQQPNKGRRMILFSTKGNPTTRDNIINVFGVKTMNALITLDLKFELEPTSGPNKRWTSQPKDGTSREISVRGHVSRPAHGEGRQTPDRQMFFVNGRPCGLPQFAKVFNEVYRSYNATQSPFIFADIQLDTDLYDVNVSPDKRTILLHDQGRMLDSLRESLIELFEIQDVTIPVAVQKQTPFKKLTTPTSANDKSKSTPATSSKSREISQLIRSHARAESATVDDDAGDQSTGNDENDDEDDDEDRVPTSGQKDTVRPPISLKPSSKETPESSLLGRWVSRDTAAQQASNSVSAAPEAKTQQSELDQDENEDAQPAETGTDPSDTAERDNTSPDLPEWRGARLKTFEDRLAELRSGKPPDKDKPEPVAIDNDIEMERPESPVPAIPPPSQLPPPKASLVSSPRKPKLPNQEVATITIGDHTVTSIIGSAAKRPGVAELPTRTSPAKQSLQGQEKRTFSAPSFGGRLSQLFSASASSQSQVGREAKLTTETVHVPVEEYPDYHSDGEEQEEEDEEEEEEEEEGEEVDEGPAPSGIGGSFIQDGDANALDDDEEEEEDTLFVNGDAPMEVEEDIEMHSEKDEKEQSQRSPSPINRDEDDQEYIEDDAKKIQHEKKGQEKSAAAENDLKPSEDGRKRSEMLLKPKTRRKDSTMNIEQRLKVNPSSMRDQIKNWQGRLLKSAPPVKTITETMENGLDADEEVAEARLSLKISKSDFENMKVIGQFNLGFVLAVREAEPPAEQGSESHAPDDELFIIDQHASDEKYNFERLQAITVVQSQRLVQPKTLELTAVEEEIIMENLPALERNGFNVRIDDTGDQPVGSRCQLLSLPLSRETTFSLADLEELLFLLADNPTSSATTVPRPSKVRKMFAMRACRSSIMIGRALSHKQMEKVVRHMGEMEKPWNCPHGRPTMRHLCGLGAWADGAWSEETHSEEATNNWVSWVKEKKADMEVES